MNYVYCYLSYFGYQAGQATMDGFWSEMARVGKDRNPYRAGFLQFVGVAENREQAFALYSEAAEYFYGRCLHIDPRFAGPPGYATEATQHAGMQSQVSKAASYTEKFKDRPSDMQTWWTPAMSSSVRRMRSLSSCGKSRSTSMSAT